MSTIQRFLRCNLITRQINKNKDTLRTITSYKQTYIKPVLAQRRGIDVQCDIISANLINSNQQANYSTPSRLPPESDYQDVKKFLDEGGLVIDVREVNELQNDGIIPKTVNIPLREVKGAFDLTPEQFEEKYQVAMPESDDAIIFSCLAGIRSAKAEAVVNSLGYTNTSNYRGGFADWVQHNR
eukprot:TRINITY_DN2740_c0_g1_i5.p1 TRINITY_DN2740_c0_g1~~TRINITY_DN2740_c0_g1_i5.p1  ORF type:complete len:183 (-),score=23.93 TRINITY_DN2740_c0_g1_i5:130-678(-)